MVSLEWQAELRDAGQRLATRAKVPMRFVHGDAFSDAAKELVQPEQHAVALHACGELHMRLLQVASQRQSRTVTISLLLSFDPCSQLSADVTGSPSLGTAVNHPGSAHDVS